MRFRIEEKTDKPSGGTAKKSYRISISLKDSEIILLREFFYIGFTPGEQNDKFYFDNEVQWQKGYRSSNGITHASFITQNLEPDYLQKKEKELIEIFYKKLIKSQNNWERQKKSDIKECNKKIEYYKNIQNSQPFLSLERIRKLEKIDDNTGVRKKKLENVFQK